MGTVFIIGAGASNEIGMPIGIDLRNSIIDILTGVKECLDISNANLSCYMNKSEHIKKARDAIMQYYKYELKDIGKIHSILEDIIQSLEFTSSIDNLLYDFRNSPDVQAIGKIAIVTAILKAENESALANPTEYYNIKPTLEGTWYYSLFLELNKQAVLSEFVRRLKDLYFIIFNYDRTLEYYFYNAIIRFYKTNPKETADIVNNMNIYHPYGQTGFLDFQENDIKNSFGKIQTDNILLLSSLIKTFMLDNIVNDEEYKKACDFLYNSEKVFFLGFAFYPQNINLLYPQEIGRYERNEKIGVTTIKEPSFYYGTFYNISSINREKIISMIKMKNQRINSFIGNDMKCVDLFNELSSIISFVK
jgi:hypothetical protein